MYARCPMPAFLAPASTVSAGQAGPGPRPSFSVVIPAYQAAATIGEAIDSLRTQTLGPAQIIVCDDGSTDDLDAALEAHRDVIELLRQDHQGVAAARNALLHAASGDFIVPLDADDVYASGRLQRLAELAISRPDLDILATDAHFVVDGVVVGRFNAQTPFAVERQGEAILDRCFLICPAMRRASLIAVGGYDQELHSAEDWDCCIRLIHAGAAAGLVDEPLLEYRLGSASLTSHRAGTLMDRVRIFEKAVADPSLSGPERRAARSALSRHGGRALQQIAREAVLEANPKARRHLFAVVRSPDIAPRARVGALVAMLSPSRTRRIVEATLSDSTGRPLG